MEEAEFLQEGKCYCVKCFILSSVILTIESVTNSLVKFKESPLWLKKDKMKFYEMPNGG